MKVKVKFLKLWRSSIRRQARQSVRFAVQDLQWLAASQGSRSNFINGLPEVQGKWPEGCGDPCVFAACDERYFNLHAETLIASVAKHSPGACVHLHFYNPRPEQFDTVDSIRGRYASVQISYTWEQAELWNLSDIKRRVYYQSARYVRLYQLLASSRRAAVCLDIDSLLRVSIERIRIAAGQADVGLFLRSEHSHRGKKVLASFVYAGGNDAGLSFFGAVAGRLAAHLAGKGQTEFLDQRVLWKTYRATQANCRVWEVSRKFSDWQLADDSWIWHAEGQRDQLVRYQDEVKAIHSQLG